MAEVEELRVWVTRGAYRYELVGKVLIQAAMDPAVEVLNVEAAQAIFAAANATSVWIDEHAAPEGEGVAVTFHRDLDGEMASALTMARAFQIAQRSKLSRSQLSAMKCGLTPLAFALARVGELLGEPVESISIKAISHAQTPLAAGRERGETGIGNGLEALNETEPAGVPALPVKEGGV